MSQLGYFFKQTTDDTKDYDLMTTELNNNDDLSGATTVSHQVHSDKESDSAIESNIEEDLVNTFTINEGPHTVDINNNSDAGIVCVVQATRIPAIHKKILQVKVIDIKLCENTLTNNAN